MDAYLVDAFAERAFSGNPAGVVLLTEPRDERWMQAVAAEFNQAETAFVDLTGDRAQPLPLRWFTPVAEVALCGHATLATSVVLGGDNRFATRSGVLVCRAGEDGAVEMDFPADPTAPARVPLSRMLPGVAADEVAAVVQGREDVLVEVADEAAVRRVRPDLAAVVAATSRGLIVTARADGGTDADFVSRCFYPAVGIDEDPVTGSAHCTLAGYWAQRLGRVRMAGVQLSRRGGRVGVHVLGDRVNLSGRAVIVLSGTLSQ